MLIQPKMMLSEYGNIYDRIIPKDNMLRKIKELVSTYCNNSGRGALQV